MSQEMSDLAFETHETRLADGRKLVLWTLTPADRQPHPLPLVVGAGFARRMHHFSPVAMYGAHNGFTVCRYDPVNHVGLSDGEMVDFTMTESMESLRAAVDWTCEHTGQPKVGVLATSLTARVAFELAALSDRVALIVSAVGVVHLRETLKRVFEHDHAVYEPEGMTGYVEFERKKIERRNFCLDAHGKGWWTLEGCVEALRRASQPIVNFVGTDDDWVDPDEVEHAFTEGVGGPRKLLTLERAPHDLSKNPAVARTFFIRMMEELFTLADIDQAVKEPPFEELTKQALIERRIQRGQPPRDAPGDGQKQT